MESSGGPYGKTEPAPAGDGRGETADRTETAAETRGADATAGTETAAETRGARFARKAHRTRLYIYAVAGAALLVFIIALVTANTGRVRVSWVFGSSSVSLVWLVLFAAILGLLLGLVIGALFHWRTRTPRSNRGK